PALLRSPDSPPPADWASEPTARPRHPNILARDSPRQLPLEDGVHPLGRAALAAIHELRAQPGHERVEVIQGDDVASDALSAERLGAHVADRPFHLPPDRLQTGLRERAGTEHLQDGNLEAALGVERSEEHTSELQSRFDLV